MHKFWIISVLVSIGVIANSDDSPPKSNQITVKPYFPKKCTELTFLPMPKSIHCDLTNTEPYYLDNPCNIKYVLKINKTSDE